MLAQVAAIAQRKQIISTVTDSNYRDDKQSFSSVSSLDSDESNSIGKEEIKLDT